MTTLFNVNSEIAGRSCSKVENGLGAIPLAIEESSPVDDDFIFSDDGKDSFGMGVVVTAAVATKVATTLASITLGILGKAKAKRNGVEAEIAAVQEALDQLPREISKLKRAQQDLLREIRKFPDGNGALRKTGLGGFLFFGKSKLKKAREKRDGLKANLKKLETEALDLVDTNENLSRLLTKLREASLVKAENERRKAIVKGQLDQQQKTLQAGVATNNALLIGGTVLLAALVIGGKIIQSRKQPMGRIDVV